MRTFLLSSEFGVQRTTKKKNSHRLPLYNFSRTSKNWIFCRQGELGREPTHLTEFESRVPVFRVERANVKTSHLFQELQKS